MTATLPRAPAEPAEPHRPEWWVRPALALLLVATAVLYLWNLTASGYGNGFYAAATQAATQSWKAWLFGSLDSGNVVTVDKPPAFLWVSGLFARIFGFSSWTVLAPQALAGVAAVGLLHATVKRTSGPVAGLLAGAAMALTPVATLMFRFNHPDALLVLLMVASAYCTVRSLERANAGWLALAGAAIGFAFLTKMGQGLLVLPALGLVYLVAAPTPLPRRLLHLAGAALAMVVSAGWFIALVALWPASSRPYIGGSTDDSMWELAIGYNGLGRLFGNSSDSGMAGGGSFGFGGSSGVGRLFGADMGTEISWLLPAALIGLIAGLWFTRRTPRTNRTRAALLLWGGWLLVTGVVFSFMSGIIHSYYMVALAPAITALVAIAGRELWRGRDHFPARVALALMVASTGFWSFILLDRASAWLPVVRWTILVPTVLATTAIVLGLHRLRNSATTLAATVAITGLLGTTAYSLATAATPHTGALPTSGPAGYSSGMDVFGGGEKTVTGDELIRLLQTTTGTWAAATDGAQSAASLSLSSGKAVIGIGGFSGADPVPTLAEFRQYVADGQVGYYVPGGIRISGGTSDIGTWVGQNFTATTVDGQQVYDLGR